MKTVGRSPVVTDPRMKFCPQKATPLLLRQQGPKKLASRYWLLRYSVSHSAMRSNDSGETVWP